VSMLRAEAHEQARRAPVRRPADRTTMAFSHTPVLLEEVLRLAASLSPRLILDGTVGGGGHAAALLEAHQEARLIGIDRDPEALAAAGAPLSRFGERVRLVLARFSGIENVLKDVAWGAPDAALVDLGVSSYQLNNAARGFSFRADGPLDMRMGPDATESARELCARLDVPSLTQALVTLGEERHARRVARAVIAEQPATTRALADIVRRLVPRAKDGIDPATRTFQALRMLVNSEIDELAAYLAALPQALAPGGVAIVISFHSLEDRAVKAAFRAGARECVCPPELPTCVCGGHRAVFEVLTPRPLVPSPAEIARNPRAKSAKLRAALQLARPS
jgi:16S rRNA (cytosine1402-N4)-methyltransferase